MRGRHIDVQGLGQHPMLHRHGHLHDARDARRRRCMTHVRLDRPQPQGLLAILAVGRQNSLCLNGIPKCGAGSVAFDDVHVGRGETGTGQCGANDPLLGWTVRRSQAVGGTVLIHRRPPHHRQHRMPQPLCVGQPLHHESTGALGEGGPVGRTGVRLAPTVDGKCPLPAEFDEHGRGGHHCHAADQRQIAFPRPQRLHGKMECHQRR